MISLGFGEVGTLVADEIPPDVLDVVQQTLAILSQDHLSQEDPELQTEQTVAVFSNSNGKFEHILVSRLFDLLATCIQAPSPLTEDVRMSCLRMCLTGLWHFAKMLNQSGNSVHLPSYIYSAFSDPVVTRHIHQEGDLTIRVMGHCIRALVINKLAVNIKSYPVTDPELACLSAILDTESHDVKLCLSQSGAVELVNMASPTRPNICSAGVPSDIQDVVQQTFGILSMDQADTLVNAFNGKRGFVL
jgi:hypothetical protein